MLHITFSKYDCIIVHKAYYLFTCTCVSVNSFHSYSICLLYTLRKEKKVVTQTYQIITKHTQHRDKLIIYMITLIHKFIL